MGIKIQQFLSTPSARRATYGSCGHRSSRVISIHALREEGDLIAPTKIDLQAISIHALREEGDLRTDAPDVIANISIHALREEGDYNTEAIKLLLKEFLSTPSARRATSSTEDAGTWYFLFLSTPSARRATLGMIGGRTAAGRFLSTPSARRATARHRDDFTD